MSQIIKDGKDTIIFATKEDHQSPSKVILSPPEPDQRPGHIFPDGSINWKYPSLQITGPCKMLFKEAFTCYHYSQEESKGMECREKATATKTCMKQYPKVYSKFLNAIEKAGETVKNEKTNS
ncbi:mitochondrial intermembrane space import and assembly protein 40-B-like [Aphis gossypii]|uniref:mitochondrial intermembrane space import and assembly protein 40-B-like n=1 Tax=Aphis gossypii TaxID=80765 RepID=UPI00100F2956|nr:mitochondrial intermembrane space import and assembly protein 40-B-like [Aphis gossypii]